MTEHPSEGSTPTPHGRETGVQNGETSDSPQNGVSAPYPFDISGLDAEAREMLRVMYSHGGEATTTRLREEGGLSRNQVNYRYRKLRDRELIHTYEAVPDHGSQRQTHAQLTDLARSAIDDGLLDDIQDAHTNLRQIRAKLTELERAVEDTSSGEELNWVWDDVSANHSEIESLKDRVEKVKRELEKEVQSLERSIQTYRTRETAMKKEVATNRLMLYRVAQVLQQQSISGFSPDAVERGNQVNFDVSGVFKWRSDTDLAFVETDLGHDFSEDHHNH